MTNPDHVFYPTEIPTHCFAELVDVITSGDLSGNADRGVKAAWTIIGWGAGLVLGDPARPGPLLALSSAGELAARYEAVAVLAAGGRVKGPVIDILLSQLIAQLMEYLLELIRDWTSEIE